MGTVILSVKTLYHTAISNCNSFSYVFAYNYRYYIILYHKSIYLSTVSFIFPKKFGIVFVLSVADNQIGTVNHLLWKKFGKFEKAIDFFVGDVVQ